MTVKKTTHSSNTNSPTKKTPEKPQSVHKTSPSGQSNPHSGRSSASGKPTNDYATMSDIPKDLPPRGPDNTRPGGIQPTTTTQSGSTTQSNDFLSQSYRSGKEWLNHLKTGKTGNEAPAASRENFLSKAYRSGKEWLDYLKNGVSGAFGKISGQISKSLNRLTNNKGDERPTDMTATSGVTNKVGYARPRGTTEYSDDFIKALKGSNSLHEALGKLDGKNVCPGLDQRPQHVEPEKVGDQNYRNSNATVSKDNKDPNVQQFIGGFAGNDGGSINFDKTVKNVTDAIGKVCNDAIKSVKSDVKAKDYKAFFDKVANFLNQNPDKKAVVTTYTATHGNVYNNGSKRKDGKEGGGNGSTLGIDEKTYDKFVRDLKQKFAGRVVVNDIWDCCHAGAWMPSRKNT